MKKKILIGSIIAVALLTLVSFSSVVGFQSVKSDSKIASPLFGIRTNRAINKEKDAVTSDYIGKGKAINILLPRKNNNVELVEKCINIIIDMDETTFQRFFDRLEKSNQVEDDDFQKIKEISIQMRKTSNTRLSSNEYTEIIPFDTEDEYPSFIGILFNFFIFLIMMYLIIFTGWTVACPL